MIGLIKLTLAMSGKPVFINPDAIESVTEETRKNQYEGYTLVAFTTSDDTVCYVIESPETVAKMIDRAIYGPYVTLEVSEGEPEPPKK